jgi:tetratricopeptide (TPR) repeat protein
MLSSCLRLTRSSCGFIFFPVDDNQLLRDARALMEGEMYHEALARYEILVKKCPDSHRIWFEWGCAAEQAGDIDAAEAGWQRAKQLADADSDFLLEIGARYLAARRPAKAMETYLEAAAMAPGAINPKINVALELERHHRFDEAREQIDSCLRIDSNDEQARFFLAKIERRENRLDTAEGLLRDLVASEVRHPYVVYACRYELAQILDKTGRFDEAMRFLIEAKRMVSILADIDRVLKSYDKWMQNVRSRAMSLPRTILHTWARSFPEAARLRTPATSFIGGHPRSGTTLLEQILDSHPRIKAFDEPHAVNRIIAGMPAGPGWYFIPRRQLNELRRLYVSELCPEGLDDDDNATVLVDKNPSPTVQLPCMLRAFPELRVIIAVRDPRDVVISCFFQNLSLNQVNANFLSFERLARHYSDLMDIWLAVREWKGFAWIETRYEDVVRDLEQEGRKATAFLGLPWHPEQADYFTKSRQKSLFSPTYHEVTKPVYASSVSRWHAYEKYVAPILPLLAGYCSAFGYG